jgi:hypothetical protein
LYFAQICREDCELLESSVCENEYAIAKQQILLGDAHHVLPNCAVLPVAGTKEAGNCIRLGMTSIQPVVQGEFTLLDSKKAETVGSSTTFVVPFLQRKRVTTETASRIGAECPALAADWSALIGRFNRSCQSRSIHSCWADIIIVATRLNKSRRRSASSALPANGDANCATFRLVVSIGFNQRELTFMFRRDLFTFFNE